MKINQILVIFTILFSGVTCSKPNCGEIQAELETKREQLTQKYNSCSSDSDCIYAKVGATNCDNGCSIARGNSINKVNDSIFTTEFNSGIKPICDKKAEDTCSGWFEADFCGKATTPLCISGRCAGQSEKQSTTQEE